MNQNIGIIKPEDISLKRQFNLGKIELNLINFLLGKRTDFYDASNRPYWWEINFPEFKRSYISTEKSSFEEAVSKLIERELLFFQYEWEESRGGHLELITIAPILLYAKRLANLKVQGYYRLPLWEAPLDPEIC
ncbi:MAG: hypothetical protein AAFY45_27260 [Bacteroidota bacterium]